MRRAHAQPAHPRQFLIGLGVLAACVLLVIVIVGGVRPFGSTFRVDVVVSSANQVRVGSPVRLAGVDIGRVDAIEAGPDHTSRLRLNIDKQAGRLRSDATAAVLPRLLLEGNAYVDLTAGTPTAPRLAEGATIPLQRTHVAVQLDQLLGVFDRPTREDLTSSLHELSTGFDRGGAHGLRAAARELDASLADVRSVARAAQGEAPADLSRAVGGTGAVSAQLARNPAQLADLVSNYDRVFATLAANSEALEGSARGIDGLLRSAPPRLASIDRALPPLRQFAAALAPTLQRAPQTLRHASAMLVQLNGLVGPRELPGLLADARPAVEALPALVTRLRPLMQRLGPIARCVSHNVIPTLNMKVPDGGNSTGRPVWQDALHLGVALASFSNTFDGNGTALRLGTQVSETGLAAQLPGGGKIYGAGDIVGRAPISLPRGAADLQYRPDVPCETQALPDLSQRRTNGLPPGLTRISRPTVSPTTRSLVAALTQRDKSGVLAALRRLLPSLWRQRRPGLRPAAGLKPEPPVLPVKSPVLPVQKPVAPATPKVLEPVEGILKAATDVLHGLGKRPGR